MRGPVMRRCRPARPATSSSASPDSPASSRLSTRMLGIFYRNSDTELLLGTKTLVLGVFVGDDLVQLFAAARLHETRAELRVLEQTADPRQGLQVHARRVLG